MTMLTGIKAFEARWQALRDTYVTTLSESRLLMQAMGRLIDNYATQEEIAGELPFVLQGLFLRLVDAYLNGYWLEDAEQSTRPVFSPALLSARQLRQQEMPKPTAASEARTYIIPDVSADSGVYSMCVI
ncbi:MAG: hypothetical protein WBB01_00210 [Phormidesmis sp.]